ncbi:MAG TPA: type II secretion system minor pseudopilin GspJ [Steroidobacteraceae bacterium]|nr:type II secretion system minor pseudopilin GspJ [Steroidobacteraceae bacterium]
MSTGTALRLGVRGFTLIELLVALFIAALMFAMGYGAINQALQNRGTIQQHQAKLVALESAMQVMEQDFVQLAPRPVRQPVGDGYLPCLQGGPASATSDTPDTSDTSDTSAPLVVLTRAGWSNSTGVQRSELERVAYVLDDGTLVREHWNVLDATLSSAPIKRNLLKNLRNVTFRYLQPTTRAWVTTWPTAGAPLGGGLDAYYRLRPMAVEVTLDTKDWGKIVRIFEIAQ